MTNKITILKEQIKEQREWGNNNLADFLAADLAAQLEVMPQCWIDCSTTDDEFVVVKQAEELQ